MTKRMMILMLAVLFMIACGKTESTKTTETKEVKDVKKVEKKVEKIEEKKVEVKKEVVLSVDDFKLKAKELIEKEITVSGIAVHVCKESGKKLFLGGTDPKNKVKIVAGDAISKFDLKLEGETLAVKGIVKELKVDEAYIDLQIKKVNEAPVEEKKAEEKKEHHDDAPKADGHHKSKADSLKQLEGLRTKVKASKEGYIAFYSLEFISMNKVEEVKKTETAETKEETEKK